MKACAWDHASPLVQDHATLMATMSDSRQGSMEITARVSFSLADAIVLEHRLGLSKAANVILLVDPWCYAGEETRASAGIKGVFKTPSEVHGTERNQGVFLS